MRSAALTLLTALLAAGQSQQSISIYEHVKQPGRRVMALDGKPQPGRSYKVNDKLGDPVDFLFAASNTLGVYEIGDRVPLFSSTKLAIHTAGDNTLKLVCDGQTVAEAKGARLEHTAQGPGVCHAQVFQGDALWIETEPMRLERPAPGEIRLPSSQIDASVDLARGVAYSTSDPEAADKQRLDVYTPKDRGTKLAPVFFFIHGGSWRSGDRSQYPALGNYLAKQGAVVVIPSYRLAPKYKHPVQAEDAAAALAWTIANVKAYGGDPERIYIGGHSAGGHLAALIALDGRYLAAHQASTRSIRGVIAMSGVYEIANLENAFGTDPQVWRQASPQSYVRQDAPPFIVTYCQWDYATLPAQARGFHGALRKAGVRSELVYVPGQNHISELINAISEGDVTGQSMLRLIGLDGARRGAPEQSGGSK